MAQDAKSAPDQDTRTASGFGGLRKLRRGLVLSVSFGLVLTVSLLAKPRHSCSSVAGLDQPQAVAILEQEAGSDADLGAVLTKLGGQYLDAGRFADALPTLQRAVAVLERANVPREHILVCLAYHQLAVAHKEMGHNQKSIELDLQNLHCREKTLGEQHPHVLLSLLNLATAYGDLGQHGKSLQYTKLWLERNRQGLGDRHPLMEQTLHRAGAAHLGLRNPEDAMECFRRAVEIQMRSQRPPTDYTLVNASLVASLLQETSPPRLEEAEAWARRATEIADTVSGQATPVYGTIHHNLGLLLQQRTKYEDAEQALLQSISVRQNAAEDRESLDSVAALIDLYIKMGRYEDALHWIESLKLAVELDPQPPEPQIAYAILYALGDVYRRKGDAATGEAAITNTLDMLRKKLPDDDLGWANALCAMGESYIALRQPDRAKQCFERAFNVRKTIQGARSPGVAHTEARMGHACLTQTHYAEAERHLQAAIAIYRRSPDCDKVFLTQTFIDLGIVLQRLNRFNEAEEAMRNGLAIGKKCLGDYSENVAYGYACLGRLCLLMERYDEAQASLSRSIEIQKKVWGENVPEVAWCHVFLANLFHEEGELPEAEQHILQALTVFEKSIGLDQAEAMVALSTLADIYLSKGSIEQASQLYQHVLDAPEFAAGQNTRDRMIMLERAALVSMLQGDTDNGSQRLLQARKVALEWLHGVLPAMSPDEQLLFLENTEKRSLVFALSHVLKHRSEQQMVDVGAECLINGKALGNEAYARQMRLSRQLNDPDIVALQKKLRSVRDQLSEAAFRPDRSANRSLQHQAALLQQEHELLRRLGQAVDGSATARWLDLGTVRAALPEDAVIVEIAQVPNLDWSTRPFAPETNDVRYAAWIIPSAGTGEVSLFDLGPAARIDRAVAEARATMEPRPALNKEEAKRAASFSRQKCAAVAELVWEPIRDAVAGKQLVLISPSSALWLFPWEAIPVANDRYLIEEVAISYLVSSREVMALDATSSSRSSALFADPDYNCSLADAGIRAKGMWQRFTETIAPSQPTGLLHASVFPPERETRRLADEIAATLARDRDTRCDLFCGVDASERAFMRAHRPRFLVVGTHGFFLQDQLFDNFPLTEKEAVVWQAVNHWRLAGEGRGRTLIVPNPLMRCGLAFAGANKHASAVGGNDGIVTGLEILNVDLQGTELAVLCACETGEGAVRPGEGIAGLRHAFQLAGAQSVVASLWSVPADESSRLIVAFFKELAELGKAKAFRQAKLGIINELRHEQGFAHPGVWAGFTLTGNWR